MKKLSLTLALILIAATLGCVQTGIAFAASETIYTGVIEDLQKDETFDAAAYPAKTELSDKDKVMDVIQIAESNAGELFLYVYQPQAGKFTATEVRISTSIGENIAPEDKKLTLLDRNGTLEKYKVEELQVKTDVVRYYLIIQIARPWDDIVDGESENDNTVRTVPYDVSKLYTACTDKDGIVTYTEQHAETIRITAKYCGFVRNFIGWAGTAVANIDSHFIAFSTNRPINRLMKATVTYDSYTAVIQTHKILGTVTERYKDEETTKTSTVKADEQHTIPSVGWSGQEYTWTEIERASDFLKREEVSAEMRSDIADKQWVLRFVATAYAKVDLLETYEETITKVSNASILDLTFETDGVVFNLGVVDNKQSGSDDPINDTIEWWQAFLENARQWFENAGKWFDKYWWVIIAVLAVIVLGILSAFIKPVAKVLWWILKIIFYIVTLPVWLIIWGVRAIKKKKEK